MSSPLLGVALMLFRRYLDRNAFAARRVETLFWAACIGFVGLILLALLLSIVAPSPTSR